MNFALIWIRCVRTHTQLYVCMVEPCAQILDNAYAFFSTDSKNYIFTDLIIQRYKHINQTIIVEP